MLKTNEPTRVIRLQKLANQSILNGALAIEIVSNRFSESKKNVGHLIKPRNVRMEKKKNLWALQNIFALYFIKYLSYLEVQKNSFF